jgi:hypothetical protein
MLMKIQKLIDGVKKFEAALAFFQTYENKSVQGWLG